MVNNERKRHYTSQKEIHSFLKEKERKQERTKKNRRSESDQTRRKFKDINVECKLKLTRGQ
jgi:hypothetical protein